MGYFFVHGVGNQKPGDALKWGDALLAPIRDVYGADSVTYVERPLAGTPGAADVCHAEAVIDVKGERHRVLLAEGFWAEHFRAIEKASLRRTLLFTLGSLPLLAWVIGPDVRDLESPDVAPMTWRESLRSGVRGAVRGVFRPSSQLIAPETRMFARLLWRLFTLGMMIYGVVVGVLLAFSGSWGYGVLAAAVLLLLGLWTRSRWNVISHVRVAARSDTQTDELVALLHSKLSWLEAHCDEVVIVAHSQGGYLMHRTLAQETVERHPKVRSFVGVGSGLRPISLLRTLNRPALKAAAWLAISAAPLWLWSIGPLTWETFGREIGALLRACYMLLHVTVMPVDMTGDPRVLTLWSSASSTELHHLIGSLIPETSLDLAHILGIGFSLSTMRFAHKTSAAALRAQPPESLDLDHRRRHIAWQEYSSPHDMVGRMVDPPLPSGVDQPWLPVAGHPLLDHVLYFQPHGALPSLLAADLFQRLSNGGRRRLAPLARAWKVAAVEAAEARRQQAGRRRLMHGLLLTSITALLLAPALARHSSFNMAILNRWVPVAILLLLLSGLFGLIAHCSTRPAAQALAVRLRASVDGPPPTYHWSIHIVPPAVRRLVAIPAFLGAASSLFGTIWFFKVWQRLGDEFLWLGYGLLLPLGIGFLLVACAAASGYPVRWRWPGLFLCMALLALRCPPAPALSHAPWHMRSEVTLTGWVTLCALLTLAGTIYARRRAINPLAHWETSTATPVYRFP